MIILIRLQWLQWLQWLQQSQTQLDLQSLCKSLSFLQQSNTIAKGPCSFCVAAPKLDYGHLCVAFA